MSNLKLPFKTTDKTLAANLKAIVDQLNSITQNVIPETVSPVEKPVATVDDAKVAVADAIATGEITVYGNALAKGAVDLGSDVCAGNLSADRIEVGELNGFTLVGGTVETAKSGNRVVIQPVDVGAAINFVNDSGIMAGYYADGTVARISTNLIPLNLNGSSVNIGADLAGGTPLYVNGDFHITPSKAMYIPSTGGNAGVKLYWDDTNHRLVVNNGTTVYQFIHS